MIKDCDEKDANTKTHTGAHTRDRNGEDDSTKTLTGALKTLTGTLHSKMDNSTKTHTGVHTRDHDKRDASNKTPTRVLNNLTRTRRSQFDSSTKTHTGVHTRDLCLGYRAKTKEDKAKYKYQAKRGCHDQPKPGGEGDRG